MHAACAINPLLMGLFDDALLYTDMFKQYYYLKV